MRVSNWKLIGVALLAVVSLAAAVASPAAAKATKIFNGEGFTVKADQLSGWTSTGDESADPVYIAGRTGNPDDGLGPIKWLSWNRKKAVGVGRGWTASCASVCLDENPWNGNKVRATAYGKRNGSFRKLKIFQWTHWMDVSDSKRENYTMKLSFSGGQWTVTSIEDGKA